MLIFAGPSSAVKVKVDGLGGTHYAGDSVTFYVNVSLLAIDSPPIDNVTITGLRAGKLVFDESGNELIDEKGLYTVCLFESTAYYGYGYRYGYDEATGYGYNFGYGYGYGYGIADEARASYRNYKIVMRTSGLSTGTDTANVYVYTGNPAKSDFKTSATFTLSKRPSGGGGGGGTYPPGWDGTPTPTVTATGTPTTAATAAPPDDKATPAPTKKPAVTKATTPTAEGTAAETATEGAPGFTAVFAIAGMLAVAYAMMRRRG